MPAKSKKQQRAAGMAYAAKKGELAPSKLEGAAKEMYDSMSEDELKKFAKTKSSKLPDKVKSECVMDPNSFTVTCDTEIMLDGEKYLLETGDRITVVNEGIAETASDIALDVAGLVPGVGELFDAAHAALYVKRGDMLSAALTLMAMVPGIGDAFGKGVKWFIKGGGDISKFLIKFGDDIIKYWDKAVEIAKKDETLKKYVSDMDSALRESIDAFNEK